MQALEGIPQRNQKPGKEKKKEKEKENIEQGAGLVLECLRGQGGRDDRVRGILVWLCDIHHGCVRRESIVFSVWRDDIILYLDDTPFIVSSRSYSMGFNSVTNREKEQTDLYTIHSCVGSVAD